MNKLIWIARKRDGKLIALTEKEALIHFKPNNVADRMRLEFIGTSDGKTYMETRKQLWEENKEALEHHEDQPTPDSVVRLYDELDQKALEAEAEVAKANGLQQPDRGLDVVVRTEGMDPMKQAKAKQNLSNRLV